MPRSWTALVVLMACEPPAEDVPAEPDGGLLIEQVYYSGSPPAGGTDHYFSDQFIAIVNTASTPVDAAGLLLGDAYGIAGAINPGSAPDSYAHREEVVVLANLWRIPRDADAIVQPGERLIIAQDGTNHRPFSSLDLSAAHFETWVDSGRDDDHPTVPNLESVHYSAGFDWLVTVFGPSIAIIEADAEIRDRDGPIGPLVAIPVEHVLDGVDALMDSSSEDFKRFPDTVDAGFSWVSGTYTGESIRRLRTADGWQDTNNSSHDFQAAAPDATLPSISAGDATGTPSLELGRGGTSFAASNDGDEATLIAGPQGGWHVDVGVRTAGFDIDGVVLTYSVTDADGASVGFDTTALLHSSSVLEDGDSMVRVGDRVVFDVADGASLVDTEVTIQVTAELADVILQDARTWRLVQGW